MNLGVLQCKNCWKWKHTTFTCYTHGAKCQKCNGPHKIKYYREIVQCYKTNFKNNSPRLKTKKEEPYTHMIKYVNYKGKHYADSYNCPFQKYRFNREQYVKKSQELKEIKANLIHLIIGGGKQ